MGSDNIEKLLIDLKNLPKQKAPENFEQKLFERIKNFEMEKSRGEFFILFSKLKKMFNPILAPALTIVIVFGLIYYVVDNNETYSEKVIQQIEKAEPKVSSSTNLYNQKNTTDKIITKRKKNLVVFRNQLPLQLGLGVSLDETDDFESIISIYSKGLMNQSFKEKAVQFRIPPQESIFENEQKFIFKPKYKNDSIILTGSRPQ